MTAALTIDRFSTLEKLAPLRERWLELYACDSHANFFLSWDFLCASLATQREPWVVLAARDGDGAYLAFLPLTCARFPRIGPVLGRELSLAGSPRADYTGMLGAAGQEWRFVPALARAVEELAWDNFALSDYSDPRIAAIVDQLSPDRYRIERGDATPCPYVVLPPTFEEYVNGLSRATRRTMRAKLRKIESLPGYRLHFAAPADAPAAIELLLRLNSCRWKKDLRKRRRIFGGLFERCYASGNFTVAVLYDGETPMAAQGSFVDAQSRTLYGYMMGYDVRYAGYSPGAMLVALSLRYAIEQGYQRYELARGGEGYKTSLATHTGYTAQTRLTRRGVRVAAVNAGRRGIVAAKGLARTLLARPA